MQTTNNNMPQDGQAVKSPPKGRYQPAAPFAFDSQSTAGTDNRPVADIEAAREAQRLQAEKDALFAHATDARTGKIKPPSLESIYADNLVGGRRGQWACQATEATGSVIHRWNKIYWQAVNNEVGAGIASDWLETNGRHSANSRKAESCWDYAATRLRRRNPLPKLDSNRAIIPCSDVYLEVFKAGFQALAPDPALGMVHAINIKTGATAGRPYMPKELPEESMFAKFLMRALPDPRVRALVQEQCGMTLLPGNYSSAAWWYGVAGSGKSTLAELVEAMHRQSVRLNLETLGDRFSLEPLVGASLILVDEVECEKWAEGRFKTLVSGNGIGIDRKNEKALASYHSRAKWLITANSFPFVRDKSDGVWRRLTVVNWGVEIPKEEQKTDFHKTILEQEGQLVLDWMLEGARRIVIRGRAMADHELPEAVRMAKKRARNNCDSVRAWCDDQRVAFAADNWVPLTDVYKEYEAWCGAQGFTVNEILTSRQFWRGMTEANKVKPERKSNRKVGGKQTDCYELQVMGPASDWVRDWASAARVSVPADKTVLTPTTTIFDHYSQWATEQVRLERLNPMNRLGVNEFWEAMVSAGFIGHDSRAIQVDEGKVVELYPLVILGVPPTKPATDKEIGHLAQPGASDGLA